jgi:signal transduction histidine kinase/CHASE3 domain sensor protein
MNLKPFFKSSFFLTGIFVISLFMLLYISSISYKHSQTLSKTSDLIIQSYKIQFQLEHILSLLKDAETGQRGYIITHDTILLSPYKTAEVKIYNAYLNLKSLTAGNQQNKNLDTLLQLINLRYKLMAYSLKIVSAKTLNEKLLDENLLYGKDIMDKIRAYINMMDDLELNILAEHQKKYKRETSFSPMFTFLIMIFSLLVFIIAYIKIHNDLLKLKKSNEDLMITNESMTHAEKIGDFGIAIWDLDSKEIQFSDNLFRLLGREPQSFEATVENYIQNVHPDDREIIITAAQQALQGVRVYPLYYRIIRKGGEIRYFTSMGQFISKINRKIYIGVISDITDQQQNKLELEERNRELELSIKELESFNRVASHDLQEPLRKIETFISRFADNDMANMSEKGKEYFSKIESSANRMRILIDDLLLFSKTNKSEKVFEITNLNFLLVNAHQELAHIIEEKNAIIQSAHLPVLKVISYQIQQLFVNLIGNALKYSKPGISPVIIIECVILEVADYPSFIKDKYKKYFKISISDNGMGFDPQYSEKIFILFNRLHQKGEYPGSGIGLSICKKIVENHDGFIIAEGKPDIGATFIVYLPA